MSDLGALILGVIFSFACWGVWSGVFELCEYLNKHLVWVP